MLIKQTIYIIALFSILNLHAESKLETEPSTIKAGLQKIYSITESTLQHTGVVVKSMLKGLALAGTELVIDQMSLGMDTPIQLMLKAGGLSVMASCLNTLPFGFNARNMPKEEPFLSLDTQRTITLTTAVAGAIARYHFIENTISLTGRNRRKNSDAH